MKVISSAGFGEENHLLRRFGKDRRVRLVFLIRSLGIGGAERQLVELAKGLDQALFDITVLCFYGGGEFMQELRSANVPVISLDKKGRWDIAVFFERLLRLLRKLQPDVLHSYMTGANLAAVLSKPALPKTRVVWRIAGAYVELDQFGWLECLASRVQVLSSHFPDLIVFNSFAGRDYHLSSGFAGSRAIVIHNGIDTKRFAPDSRSGSQRRASWQIPEGSLLIGLVGRLDPIKDHQTFLRAVAIFSRSNPDARFVCIGGGPETYFRDLRALGERLDVAKKVAWSGSVSDMSSAYNALDICCSSSYGEGTSNVIAEAMACGVPCVVTDVGDSALIVGETGVVVPPRNPEALAAGWAALAQRKMANSQLSETTQKRIELHFGLPALVSKTSESLLDLL